MIAKATDDQRIQEMYDIATETIKQFGSLGLEKERFLRPATIEEELISEGLISRVMRVAEEGGHLAETFEKYGFELRAMRDLRNRIAHAYFSIDRNAIWDVLTEDFSTIVEGCQRYCQERDLYLKETWEAQGAPNEDTESTDSSEERSG